MRNKDLKARDIKDKSESGDTASETIVIESSSNSYAVLLENYYHGLKNSSIALPEENEISDFINELIWFNNLESNGATIH